ncbi:unnamed protein product [Amoebophrya sp. A120]|nr:unnamed protein product [Amoebophrya sp. A120]|eukprot:GSA120T00015725001.1
MAGPDFIERPAPAGPPPTTYDWPESPRAPGLVRLLFAGSGGARPGRRGPCRFSRTGRRVAGLTARWRAF